MIIDSHVNLHAPQFDEDRDAVIARAREAGVKLMVEISDKLSTFEATHGLAMAHEDIWCTVGAHPHEAKDHIDLTADRLIELAGSWASANAGWIFTTTSARAMCRRRCSGPISMRHGGPACRWWCTHARRTMSWRAFWPRNRRTARSGS